MSAQRRADHAVDVQEQGCHRYMARRSARPVSVRKTRSSVFSTFSLEFCRAFIGNLYDCLARNGTPIVDAAPRLPSGNKGEEILAGRQCPGGCGDGPPAKRCGPRRIGGGRCPRGSPGPGRDPPTPDTFRLYCRTSPGLMERMPLPVKPSQELKDLRWEVHKIGVNINQIASG